MVLLAAFGVQLLSANVLTLERNALRETGSMVLMVALLAVVSICVRWTTVTLGRSQEQEPRFEEEAPPAVLGLGLYRDGVMPLGPSR